MTEISELDLQNLRHLIGGFGSEAILPEIRSVCSADQTAAYAVLTVGGVKDDRKNNGSRYSCRN